MGKFVYYLLAVLSATGCASGLPPPAGDSVTTAMLLDGAALDADPGRAPDTDPLTVSVEMREFVKRHVGTAGSPARRLRKLTDAMTDPDLLALVYDDATRSADEAFRLQRGNCVSFTALFVALAREAGLTARFREVNVAPEWTDDDGIWVLRRHMNVAVSSGVGSSRIIDFDLRDDRLADAGRIISDARARAHFFNNLGVDRLRSGDTGMALSYLRTALGHDPRFAPAWNNLGALYSRHGLLGYAEAAYRHAVQIHPHDEVAPSNLARLYDAMGLEAYSQWYAARARAHRDSNPFYHYRLAERALAAGDAVAARRHLRAALRRQRDEPRFHELQARIDQTRK